MSERELVHSATDHSGKSWASPKPADRSFPYIPPWVWQPKHLGHLPLLSLLLSFLALANYQQGAG